MTSTDTRHATLDSWEPDSARRTPARNASLESFGLRGRGSATNHQPSTINRATVHGSWFMVHGKTPSTINHQPPTPKSSFLNPKFDERKRRTAFTLVEMLIVISVISVLLGLLYGSLERARTFSRRAIAFAEVKNIEAALKQYYAHYHSWPPETCIDAADNRLLGSGGDDKGFVIDAGIAKMLQGTISDSDGLNTAIKAANPDRIPFIEFARKNSDGTPINPFRLSTSTETRQYKVLFDLDNDSKIVFTEITNTTVFASVAVWTVIPGTPRTSSNSSSANSAATDEILGSWTTFSK